MLYRTLLLVVLLCSCGGVDIPDGTTLDCTALADKQPVANIVAEASQSKHKQAIQVGLTRWNSATCGLVTWRWATDHDNQFVFFSDYSDRDDRYAAKTMWFPGPPTREVEATVVINDPYMTERWAPIAMTHEIGHALQLMFDNSDDAVHYGGKEPSAMTATSMYINGVGRPELKAFCERWHPTKCELLH